MPLNVGKANVQSHADTQEELQRGDKRYWTPADGKNQIRIMPPPMGEEEIYARVGFHYQIGPDDKMFACPKTSGARKSCFLCDESDRLAKSDDEDDQADAKELRVTKRFLVTIIDLAHPQDGFKVWAVGIKLFRDILYYFSDADYGDITDLEEGFNLNLLKQGSGLNTKYNLLAGRNPSNFLDYLYDKLGQEDYDEAMFDNLPNLNEFLTFDTDAEMEAAFNGTSTGTRDKGGRAERGGRGRQNEAEDERPRRGRGAPDFEDEAEPEPEPATRGRGRAAAGEPEPARRRPRNEPAAEPEEAADPEDPEADPEDPEEAEPEPEPTPARGGRPGSTRSSGRTSGRSSAASGSGRTSAAATGERLRRGLRGDGK